jgi:signal transduction histidine kinase
MDMVVNEDPNQRGISILIVEDNLDDARLISHFLGLPNATEHGLRGVNLLNTQYLKEAEQILKSKKIDLVLLDLHLPDGQGRTLVRRLCSNFPKVPIVAMTGVEDTPGITTELMLEGAQDFIRKDTMDGPTLFRAIQYALNRQKLAIELQEQKEELSISNAELATISGIACRDFATPVNNLRTFTRQLEDSIFKARQSIDPAEMNSAGRHQNLLNELSEQMPATIEMIKTALNDMDRLSNGIRKLSLLDNRALSFQEIDCLTIVDTLLETHQAYIDANQINVNVQKLESVVADRQSMQDIFRGIIDNAIKYLDPNRRGEISISSHRDLTYTTFLIRDNGRGMTEEEQSRVFEVFQRGNNVIDISGEGMGMPYVRALVRRHRGVVWFETQLHHGTVFYFTIDNSLARGSADEALRPARDEFYS